MSKWIVVSATAALWVAGCSASPDVSSKEESASTSEALGKNKGHDHGRGHRFQRGFQDNCGDHADEATPEDHERAAKRVRWVNKKRHGKEKKVDVKILGFNDFHGQLTEGRFVGGRPVGGAAVLASYLSAARAGFEGRTLTIHAGDHVGATPPESALLQDEPAIQFLNLLAKHTEVIGTLGNHEFDEGTDELLRLLNGGNHANGPFIERRWRGATFPYVNANVVTTGKKKKFLIPPYVVKELGKVKVGVIGAVLKETPTIVTPTGVAGLSFLDEITAINAQVKELKKRNVRTIVVTIHQGAFQATYEGPTAPNTTLGAPIGPIVAGLDDEVDLVISGHSHTFSNALVATESGHQILVTQAFSASTAYDDIDLEIDVQSGDVLSKSASIVTTYSDVAPGNVRDAKVQELVTKAQELTAPLVNEVIGGVAADITRAQSTAGESALGNLIADAQRAAIGTDFAFMNPGGIRADLTYAKNPSNDADSDGLILWGELFTIQPFGNSLVRLELTGQQIYDLLNQQFAVNRFLQISGLEYTWDDSLPAESRVVEVRQDGVPIDRAEIYSVTANNFIAAGGDGFTVFLSGANAVGGPLDVDALIDYIEAQTGPLVPPPLGRITRLD